MEYSVCLHITFKFTAPSFETKLRLNRKKKKKKAEMPVLFRGRFSNSFITIHVVTVATKFKYLLFKWVVRGGGMPSRAIQNF